MNNLLSIPAWNWILTALEWLAAYFVFALIVIVFAIISVGLGTFIKNMIRGEK